MAVNAKKSACLRLGLRYSNQFVYMTVSGIVIHWVSSVRYLGVYLESSYTFRSSFNQNMCKFYRSFNCFYGKVRRIGSEEVLIALLTSKCLPMLLYGTEACPINASVKHSLEFFPLIKCYLKYLVLQRKKLTEKF